MLPLASTGCIEDTDCGICDPDNLILQSISGLNYAGDKVHLLGPTCDGDSCPGAITSGTYFIEDIGPCEETEEAKGSPRGAAEYCKISPLITAFGIEFVFNNLLDPTSVELVRKRPDNPQLFEVYDWKDEVLQIHGPITRYNGDFIKGGTDRPDEITRLINLSCIDNLAADGIGFSHTDYEDPATNPCNQLDSSGRPRKMLVDGVMKSYRGLTTTGSNSCDTPDMGADTCCSECDFLLSVQVAKYGLIDGADPDPTVKGSQMRSSMRNPNAVLSAIVDQNYAMGVYNRDNFLNDSGYKPQPTDAILCDPDPMTGDKYIECGPNNPQGGFVPWVSRSLEERNYRYAFDTPEPQLYKLPYYDKLRETHPDMRPDGLEVKNAACTTSAECRSSEKHNLPGTECVGYLETAYDHPFLGTIPAGSACTPGVTPGCVDGRCVAEWFVTCRQQPDTTGEVGLCFDKRFGDRGAGACLKSNGSFKALCDDQGNGCQTAPANTALAYCDNNTDGNMTGAECCQESIGGAALCDPFSEELTPIGVYQRNDTLPEPTRDCKCPTSGTFKDVQDDPKCADVFKIGCFDDNGKLRQERAGQYAVKFVYRPGGVIYDPAIKGFEYRPADTGNVPRAAIEACAEGRGLIDKRNREDGWRANDVFITENYEDFDRALCSGSDYTVEFNAPSKDVKEFVKDKVGNSLEGKSTYHFSTPQFHVVPGSGFPTDNLRIGACDNFSLRFSNKFDMSPENVAKVELWRIKDAGGTTADNFLPPRDACSYPAPLAGGVGCAKTQAELTARIEGGDPCAAPCLTVDIANVSIGEISVQIDPSEFGPVLRTDYTYRMVVPGLDTPDQAAEMNPDTGRLRYQDAFWDVCGMPLILGQTDETDFLYDFTVDKPKCKEDEDQDNVQLSCDNAPKFFNPDQADLDGDGVGDVIDLCPTVPGAANNSADSDKDGVGNECDSCRQTVKQYNKDEAMPLAYMLVRNIPFQDDTDNDGIGDVCDNCVTVANCQDYGPSKPYKVGEPIAYDDGTACNQDLDNDMVGDDCVGDGSDYSVGLAPLQDFDQDGIANLRDACPRQPLPEQIACTSDMDCPANTKCEVDDGFCDHLDSDNDDVGDICDTCAFAANPMQVMDGQAQDDDKDGDFVGRACETNSACENRADPRPFSFYDISANGNCCTVALYEDDQTNLINAITGNPLLNPDKLPVRVECSDAEQTGMVCAKLPSQVALTPGILNAPEGCEDALAGTDPKENRKLTPEDFDGDLDALWNHMCFLPQFDQDYDGYGDICDLCPFDFDPLNRAFIDANGKVWPKSGAYCNGDYSIENKCGGDQQPTGGSGSGGSGGSGGTGAATGGSGGVTSG